ncbi:MAG: amidohydrolase [Pirellulales bacterium]|nr:amidohydrolase [Pirellulales bacterium]
MSSFFHAAKRKRSAFAVSWTCRWFAIALLLCLHGQGARAEEARAWVEKNLPDLVKLYRDLHKAPELSFHEEQTGKRLAEELRLLGIPVTEKVGGFGVVGMLENGKGPTLMLRTDTDALPVVEQTGLVYASNVKAKDDDDQEVGVMHACGHDIHMTNLIGVAQYLASHKDRWSGTVMFVCQPAEERGSGAKAMLDDGLFTRFPKPDFAVALHVDSTLGTGKIGIREGYTLANVDSVDVTMRGRGGHGAYPQTTIDPIVLAARLVLDLQTVVSREVSPTDPAVITIGSIHGGTKHNVIGDECHLQITLRSYKPEVRDLLIEAVTRKALAIAQGAKAPEPVIKVSEGTPAMFNDEELTSRLLPVFQKALGEENVTTTEPSMGGEDFSRYGLAGVPILMFRLGAVDPQRLAGFARLKQEPPSLHSTLFYPDAEATLVTGITATTAAVLDLLPKQP